MNSHLRTRRLVLAAMFLALSYILPYFTGNIPMIGAMLLPMHLPILLCGFLCGGPLGALVGFVAPLLRSSTASMPPMFPTAVAMAFELATYGFVSGFLYARLRKNASTTFITLITAMVLGRIVWGIVRVVITFTAGGEFTFALFISGAIVNAIPGIIAQIILIPPIVLALKHFDEATAR